MKRKLLLLISLLLNLLMTAQINISGTVFDLDGNPLEGASVYLNNTSIGTTTNMEGEFYLNLPNGQYKLVVSYIGYISERYSLNTKDYNEPITFKLIPKTNVLNEIVIKKKRKNISPNRRKEFLQTFRQEFLGVSKFAKKCKIVNEDVIDFDYNEDTETLEVFVRQPLKITNKSLGYIILYDLTKFVLSPKKLTYLGNVRYVKNKGTKGKMKRWKKNRRKAYRGSYVHFLRAVLKNEIRKEGFMVDRIQRTPNPRIPSTKEIKKAYDIIMKVKHARPSSYGKNPVSEVELVKAQSIMRRAQLDPYIERLIKRNVKTYEFTLEYDGKKHFMFDDFLKVMYTRELPDKNYRQRNGFARYQTSLMSLNKEEVEIHEIGTLKEPLDVLLLGYWGFEKVGDALPLDYQPD
jgi:hypothetical protein